MGCPIAEMSECKCDCMLVKNVESNLFDSDDDEEDWGKGCVLLTVFQIKILKSFFVR